jgi:ferric-dicitrate binding protein FerR (iron transport regulator)
VVAVLYRMRGNGYAITVEKLRKLLVLASYSTTKGEREAAYRAAQRLMKKLGVQAPSKPASKPPSKPASKPPSKPPGWLTADTVVVGFAYFMLACTIAWVLQ